MSIHTDELRTQKLETLITPRELATLSPLDNDTAQRILYSRHQVEAILRGEDQRLLVIIGPCSLHDPKAALEYARRLAPLREQYAAELCLVMRAYFEKPRTIVGWKGLINDPFWTAAITSIPGSNWRANCCWRSTSWVCPPPPSF